MAKFWMWAATAVPGKGGNAVFHGDGSGIHAVALGQLGQSPAFAQAAGFNGDGVGGLDTVFIGHGFGVAVAADPDQIVIGNIWFLTVIFF